MELRAVFELILCTALPVLVSMLLYYFKYDHGNTDNIRFCAFSGVVFGIVAIFGTEIGIVSINDSIINIRNAAAICSGLFFGLPGGIIAGLIGGTERILAAYVWHSAGEYTALACALTTLLAGAAAGAFKSKMFKDKNPSVVFCLIMGIITEIVHCALVVLFRTNDFSAGMEIVKSNFLPLAVCNTVSVIVAVIAVKSIDKTKSKAKTDI